SNDEDTFLTVTQTEKHIKYSVFDSTNGKGAFVFFPFHKARKPGDSTIRPYVSSSINYGTEIRGIFTYSQQEFDRLVRTTRFNYHAAVCIHAYQKQFDIDEESGEHTPPMEENLARLWVAFSKSWRTLVEEYGGMPLRNNEYFFHDSATIQPS